MEKFKISQWQMHVKKMKKYLIKLKSRVILHLITLLRKCQIKVFRRVTLKKRFVITLHNLS